MPELRQALWDDGLSEDIYVKHRNLPGNTPGDIRSQYQQWLSAGRSTPDILGADTAFTIPFVAQRQVANLSDRLSNESISTMEDNYVTQLFPTIKSKEGDFFGVQFSSDISAILYRKDLVKEAGYDPEEENWMTESMSWKRFSNVIKDVQKQTDTKHGFVFQANDYEGLSCCNFNEWMTSHGGAYFGGRDNLFGPVGDRPITVNEEPVKNAIKMVRTFIHGQDDEHSLEGYAGNISPEQVLQFTEESSRNVFTNGNSVALRAWPFSWQKAGSEDGFGEDLGLMAHPAGVPESEAKYDGTGGHGRSFIGGYANLLNPNSKNIDAATQVLEHMIGNVEFRYVLLNSAVIPPNLEVLKSDKFQQAPVLGRFIDLIETTAQRAISRPATISWNPESTAISNQVNSSLGRQKSPSKAMSDLQTKIKQIEDRLGDQ